jgi:hypothetical protein
MIPLSSFFGQFFMFHQNESFKRWKKEVGEKTNILSKVDGCYDSFSFQKMVVILLNKVWLSGEHFFSEVETFLIFFKKIPPYFCLQCNVWP